MFEGFSLQTVDVGPGSLCVRHGGSGPTVLHVDPVAIWRNWANDVHGFGDSGHHVAEDNPETLSQAIREFLENG